jgi:hypothetical protein
MFGALIDYPLALLGGLLIGFIMPGEGWRGIPRIMVYSALPGLAFALLDFALPLLFISPTQEILRGSTIAIGLCAGLGIVGGFIGSGLRVVTRANRS